MDYLERDAEGLVLATIGGLELMKMELKPGDDHQAEIHKIEHDIDALERITGTETVITAKLAEIKHPSGKPNPVSSGGVRSAAVSVGSSPALPVPAVPLVLLVGCEGHIRRFN